MPFLTKEKTNWGYVLIVVILGLIVGGGILGYLRYFEKETAIVTKIPEIKKPEYQKVANWNTYKNKKYGFEIKYPEKWRFEQGRLISKNPLWYEIGFYAPSISSESEKLKSEQSNYTFKGFISIFSYETSEMAKKSIEKLMSNPLVEKIEKEGYIGVKFKKRDNMWVFIQKDNMIYTLNYRLFPEDSNDEKTFAQMLESFRLIKK